MSAHSMLDQLLRQGLSLLQGSARAPAEVPRLPEAIQRQGRSGMDWGSFGAGAATGAASTGALGLLLGSKQARRHAGKVAKYGGIAAIGLMAYKAYSQWQAQQAQQASPPPAPQAAQNAPAHTPSALPAPRTVDQLSGAEAEAHSRAIFGAMIAAAKADGHLDPRERSLLDAELTRLAADHALRQWVQAELERPLEPAQVALAAQGDAGLAAEMYLASLLVADDQSFMERAYLDELARQLRLAPELKTRLEAQAAEA